MSKGITGDSSGLTAAERDIPLEDDLPHTETPFDVYAADLLETPLSLIEVIAGINTAQPPPLSTSTQNKNEAPPLKQSFNTCAIKEAMAVTPEKGLREGVRAASNVNPQDVKENAARDMKTTQAGMNQAVNIQEAMKQQQQMHADDGKSGLSPTVLAADVAVSKVVEVAGNAILPGAGTVAAGLMNVQTAAEVITAGWEGRGTDSSLKSNDLAQSPSSGRGRKNESSYSGYGSSGVASVNIMTAKTTSPGYQSQAFLDDLSKGAGFGSTPSRDIGADTETTSASLQGIIGINISPEKLKELERDMTELNRSSKVALDMCNLREDKDIVAQVAPGLRVKLDASIV